MNKELISKGKRTKIEIKKEQLIKLSLLIYWNAHKLIKKDKVTYD